MTPPEREPAANDLLRQREVLRRNLVRANSVVAVILLALLALALAAVIASIRAEQNRELAEAASRERKEQLGQSLRAQARALRYSGQAGQRFAALAAISNAAALGPSTELRSDAIACLALTDVSTEWRWPQATYAPAFAFDATLQRCAFSPDGRHITFLGKATDSATLDLDVSEAHVAPGAQSAGLVISPSGRFLAARLYPGGAVVWEASSGRITFVCSTNGVFAPGGMPSFTEDEQSLVFSEPRWGTNLLRADLNSGRVESLPIPLAPARVYQMHPQGHRVAVANGNELQLLNLETGSLERKAEFAPKVSALAWSRNGRTLAAGSTDGHVCLWDVENGSLRQLFGHRTTAIRLLFSPNGERLCVSGADGTSQLLETDSGEAMLTMQGTAFQFSEDGQLAFYRHGTGLGVWRIAPAVGYQVRRERSTGRGEGWKSDLSPDGRWLALIDWDTMYVWDLDSTRPPLVMHLTNPNTLFWHPSEPILYLVMDRHMETRSVAPAAPESEVAVQVGSPNLLPLPEGVKPLMAAISRDTKTLAIVDTDGILRITDPNRTNGFVTARQKANASGPLGSGSSTGTGRLAVSPDGRWVATVDMALAPAPHIFDAASGQLVKELPTDTAAVEFSPDGRWLVTSGMREIALWSVGNWSQIWRRSRSGMPGFVGAAAFSGGGSMLAVTKSSSTIGLLDRATGGELAEFTPPETLSDAGLRMSADGRRIVAPTLNSLMQVWDLSAIRHELEPLGLDWGKSPDLPIYKPKPLFAWASPTSALLLGLGCMTTGAIFALRALGQHRRLFQQFVQSEADAERRNRELEVAKVELMHSQKMKALGTLAAGIAHDFNNLLSVIRMSNTLIGRAAKSGADVAEEVANIEDAVQQGKQVVSSMLGFSREQDNGEGECDLGEAVEEAVSLLSREFLSGIELTLALDRNAPAVQVGRGRIEQILLNLVVNASEAMKGQGKLEIAVHRHRSQQTDRLVLRPREADALVELKVADSGSGIALEILPRIFEPFFTTKTAGAAQGTGLGLSMVYSIAEKEGLGIQVESLPGRGTTFRILLPAGEARKKTKPPVRQSHTSQAAATGAKREM
jgi:signal transduction histidine kinase